MGILSYVLSPLGAYNDSKTKKASKKAVQAVQDAADKNTALAQNIYNTTRNDLAPGRAVYGPSISALAARSGLGGATSTGVRGTAGTSPVEPAGFNPTAPAGGGSDKAALAAARGPIIGYGPTDQPIYAQGGAPAAPGAPSGQPDYAAYGAANPDLQQEWAHIQQTGNADGFGDDPNAYFKWHYDTYGQNEGRPLPGVDGGQSQGQPPAQPPESGQPDPQGGGAYIDPNGDNYGAGQAPAPYDPSAGPQWKDPGSAPAFDFKFDANADPGYAWAQSEAARGGNASFGAKGLLKSGGAIKAAQDRSFHLADTRFNTAYDQYMQRLNSDRSQFNTDRSANFNIYNTNRNFDYGATRDTRGDFETDRGFGAGRYDQDTSNLFGLSTIGGNAAAGSANAGNIFTSAASANNNNVASARANKALSDNSSSFFNQIIPAVANAAGRYASGGF